jgi:hypothetical protein
MSDFASAIGHIDESRITHAAPADWPAYPLRPSLPPLPQQMRHLPVDDRGYVIPYFVSWVDAKPEFRVMDSKKWAECVKKRKCWVCGGPLYPKAAFVIGPMCAINRTTAEPGCHWVCADWSTRACPFMLLPNAKRRDANLPAETASPGGIMLERNPGVTLVWLTDKWTLFRPGRGNPEPLIRLGRPIRVRFMAQGREATRAEIMHSIETGLPHLVKLAMEDGEEALMELQAKTHEALRLLPPETAKGEPAHV